MVRKGLEETIYTQNTNIWTPGNPLTMWTPENKNKVIYKMEGKTIVLPKVSDIPAMDEDSEFFHVDYLNEIWTQLTERMKFRFDMDGIIGLGKSTIPKIMKLYMSALSIEEDKESPHLKLFYHDMKKYAFPMNLRLIKKERPRLIRDGLKRNLTFILDRAPGGEAYFIKTLRDGGVISESEAKILNRTLEDQQEKNGSPEVLLLLKGKASTGYHRATKRGFAQEVQKDNETMVDAIMRTKFNEIHKEYLEIIADVAPQKLSKYKALFSQKLPKVLRGGGLSKQYMKILHEAYEGYETENLETVRLEINVDKVKRRNPTHQATIMNALKYSTFVSLENQGYSVVEEPSKRRVHIYDPKGEKIT